ncbi:MAG: hypothetical protein RL565_1448 [Pseudomonadota bacterium]|jgi:uncharacterized membrane protein
MTYKTKKPSGKLGLMRNQKQIDDSLAKRARLTQSLNQLFNAGLIPASWVAEIASVGGLHV